MIDASFSDGDRDLDPVIVMAPTGMLVGVYWGSRFEICQAIDEVTDPNECTYLRCEPGGIRLGCFRDAEEVSIATYRSASTSELDDFEMRFEGLSDSVSSSFDKNNGEWLPIVPPGYLYSAGTGLTKIETDRN